MNDFFEELNKLSKNLHLDQTKKAEFRNELVRFMNENPVKEIPPQTSFVRTFSLFRFRTALVPLLACAVLILGAGTSYAAEEAMPGDLLYSVKVHFNEELKAALILDSYDKANFEIVRAETRLAEADGLAAEGRFNAEAQVRVEANFNAHAERVQERIKKFEEAGNTEKAADLAAHFESSLQAHTNILSMMIGKEGEDDVFNLRKNLNVRKNDLAKHRQQLSSRITSDANQDRVKFAAEGKIKAAENTVREVKLYIDNRSSVGQNATAGADEQLKIAEDSLAEAKVKLEAGRYKESFELAGKAQRQALEAKALAKVEIELPERFQQELPGTIQRREDSDSDDNDRSGEEGSSSTETIIKSLPELDF